MKQNTKNLIKKVSAGLVAGAVVGLTLGAGVGYSIIPNPQPIVKVVNHTVEVPVEVIKYVNKTVEVPVEVIKEVPVEVIVTDTELIQATCDRLLFDDIGECQTEVKAEDKALGIAWDYLASQLDDSRFVADELVDSDLITYEHAFAVVRNYKNFDDIDVVKSNYDDSSYEFTLKVKVSDEEADVKKYLLFDISVEDGVADFIEVNEE